MGSKRIDHLCPPDPHIEECPPVFYVILLGELRKLNPSIQKRITQLMKRDPVSLLRENISEVISVMTEKNITNAWETMSDRNMALLESVRILRTESKVAVHSFFNLPERQKFILSFKKVFNRFKTKNFPHPEKFEKEVT